ncbi:19644_t:CDS:2, partial [Funneliformis geosporum]
MKSNNNTQFNTACELLNNPYLQPKISKNSEIEKAISFYQKKSHVQNTERATKNWLAHFEKFRKDMVDSSSQEEQYKIQLHLISDMSILENQDGTEYKALTIKQAVDGINRHLMEFSIIHGINLQDHHQFPVLARVLDDILSNSTTSISTPDSLIKRVFFYNAFLLACRGGEHYQLKIIQFNFCEDGGIDFQRFCAKNNQQEIMGDLANKTGIEVDGHRSIDAIRKYKVPNDQQKMDTLQHIISTYNLQDHQESQIKNITDNVS